MEYKHMCAVAKKIASLLSENEATVNDITEIFKQTKDYMVVKTKWSDKPRYLSGMNLPNQSDNGCGIWDEQFW